MNAIKKSMLAGAVFSLTIALLPADLQAQRSGVDAWSQTCGSCHTIQPPNRYNAENWRRIMSHMMVTARLSDAESEAILQFLIGGARRIAAAEQESDVGLLVASTVPVIPEFVPVNPDEDWRENCEACHGATGEGDGPAAIAFNPPPPDLTDPDLQASRTDDELLPVIRDGKGAMPGFGGQLNDARLRALVEYIRGLAQER